MNKNTLRDRIIKANYDPIVELAKDCFKEGLTVEEASSLLRDTQHSYKTPIGNKFINALSDCYVKQKYGEKI